LEIFADKIGNKDAAKNIIISTKSYACTKQEAKDALDEALFELEREYIDIFMLHEQESIHTLNGHSDALEYLFEMKEKGRIKAVGISTHHIAGVLGAVEWNKNRKNSRGKLDIIHPIYNIKALGICDGNADFQIRLAEMESALKIAKENGIFIFAMKALGGGNLFSNASEAFDFVLNKPFIDSIAVGMKSFLEVDSNILYFAERKFTHEYYTGDINSKHLHIDEWCTGCGKCESICPANALTVKESAMCDAGKCVLCGYCSSVCRDFAIKII
jgi:predicted aldo/keto reductase-like oxidoreductase